MDFSLDYQSYINSYIEIHRNICPKSDCVVRLSDKKFKNTISGDFCHVPITKSK